MTKDPGAEIRPALPVDRARIECIVLDAYAPWVPRIGKKPAKMFDDYGALIAEDRVRVAERDGQIEGVLVLLPLPGSLLLDNVAVAPAAQGKGIGRLLLDHAEAAAREAGFATITLYTNALMSELIALYARRGYVEIERREEMGHRRVYMRKSLGG